MGSNGTPIDTQTTTGSTPEDVARLYAWANLRGAKYRDYSASRREQRAQVRYRAAKSLLDRELKAQAEAETSAQAAEHEAREAEARALAAGANQPQQARFAAFRAAEVAALKAAADRVEAARRAESAARATVLALREERELSEAAASAAEQAMIYTEADALRRQLAGPQPLLNLAAPLSAVPSSAAQPASRQPSPIAASEPSPSAEAAPASPKGGTWQPLSEAILGPGEGWNQHPGRNSAAVGVPNGAEENLRPAWLVVLPQGSAATPTPTEPSEPAPPAAAMPPQPSAPEPAVASASQTPQVRTPFLAVYSPSSRAGTTSLVAGLGRAFSALGEKVLLVDTTSQARLPLYFGGRELRPGLMRTWSPPEGFDYPVSVVLHDATQVFDEAAQQQLTRQIFANAVDNQRILADLSAPAAWLLRRLAHLGPAVLVPIVPGADARSVIDSTEKLFHGLGSRYPSPPLPFYLLNQFDSTQASHLQLQSELLQLLGARLLPFTIPSSPAIAEALAEGSTVFEHAPDTLIARQYSAVAAWLQTISPPRPPGSVHLPWGQS